MDELKEIQKPLEHASTLSSNCYTAEDFYEQERGRIFHNSWQYVCRTDQVANPGDLSHMT